MGVATVSMTKPEEWRVDYKIYTAGFGFMLGMGSQGDLSATASFVTQEEWTKADFIGPFKILDGGAWFAPKASDVWRLGKDAKELRRSQTATPKSEKQEAKEARDEAFEKENPLGAAGKKKVEKKFLIS
jgi:hypothetical protein